MTNAATQQALEVGKERLREFLEQSDTGRQAMAMSAGHQRENVPMNRLDARGKNMTNVNEEDEDEEI
jgi:hypothetical protein